MENQTLPFRYSLFVKRCDMSCIVQPVFTFSCQVDEIDVSAIPPSTLANSGLLMACLMVHGVEVASVNMVVNVTEDKGRLYREIYNPLA